jgi:hypothetical protein
LEINRSTQSTTAEYVEVGLLWRKIGNKYQRIFVVLMLILIVRFVTKEFETCLWCFDDLGPGFSTGIRSWIAEAGAPGSGPCSNEFALG